MRSLPSTAPATWGASLWFGVPTPASACASAGDAFDVPPEFEREWQQQQAKRKAEPTDVAGLKVISATSSGRGSGHLDLDAMAPDASAIERKERQAAHMKAVRARKGSVAAH